MFRRDAAIQVTALEYQSSVYWNLLFLNSRGRAQQLGERVKVISGSVVILMHTVGAFPGNHESLHLVSVLSLTTGFLVPLGEFRGVHLVHLIGVSSSQSHAVLFREIRVVRVIALTWPHNYGLVVPNVSVFVNLGLIFIYSIGASIVTVSSPLVIVLLFPALLSLPKI